MENFRPVCIIIPKMIQMGSGFFNNEVLKPLMHNLNICEHCCLRRLCWGSSIALYDRCSGKLKNDKYSNFFCLETGKTGIKYSDIVNKSNIMQTYDAVE